MKYIPIFILFGLIIYLKKTEQINYPKISRRVEMVLKIFSIVCLVISISMIIDIFLPKESYRVKVRKVANSQEIIFGNFKEDVISRIYKNLNDGEDVIIKVSRIYDEIKCIELLENKKELKYPTIDSYTFILMIFIFLIPSLMFNSKLKAKKNLYFIVSVSSSVLGVVSLLLIGKLLLVHVFHVIDKV